MEIRIKGFDKNLQCSGMQFEIGKEYKIEGTNLEICSDKVFHYCKSLKEVNAYYGVWGDNRFCYIEVLGEEVCDGDLCGSNHIKILREIIGSELDLLLGKITGNTGYFNSGNRNSGNGNSGDSNSGNGNSGNENLGSWNSGDGNSGYSNPGNSNTGDYNSGHNNYLGRCNSGNYNVGNCNSGNSNSGIYNAGNHNSGDYNSGNFNTGYGNSGSYNSGHYNSGYDNSGNLNSGNRNSGNENSGFFNSCNNSSGFFCSKEPKAIIFNIETDMTISEFKESMYYKALLSAPFELTEIVEDRTIVHTYKEACKKWWKALTPVNKKIIKSMPNFNAEVFKEITGITIRNKKED